MYFYDSTLLLDALSITFGLLLIVFADCNEFFIAGVFWSIVFLEQRLCGALRW